MQSLTVKFESEVRLSDSELAEKLQHALDIAGIASHAEVCQTWKHDDWDYGQRCPECGDDVVYIYQPEHDLYRSSNDKFEFIKNEHPGEGHITIECRDCQELLYAHHAAGTIA